jgi:hypothetical protein
MFYNSIVHAIPVQWKKALSSVDSLAEPFAMDRSQHMVLTAQGPCTVESLSSKNIYWQFLNRIITPPTAIDKWLD